MSPNRPVFQKGFTLLELLVAITAGLFVVGAAVMAAEAMLQTQYGQSRKSAVDTELAVGQVILERTLANAGVGFAEPRYAVHLRNNVSSALPGTGPTISAVTAGAGSAGVIIGTDVVEMASGDTTRNPGAVVAASGNTVTLATTDPFLTGVDGGTGTIDTAASVQNSMIMMFADGFGTSCLAQVSAWTVGSKNVTVGYLDEDYNVLASPPAACPAPGMTAYVLSQRYRFLVYQQANGVSTGLYEQDNLANLGTSTLGNPQLVMDSIEDMQARPRVLNTNNVAGCGTAVPANLFCTCDDGSGGCSLGTSPNLEALVRGVNITLVGVGKQTISITGGQRPAVYDHAAGAVDGKYHGMVEQSVFAFNLALNNL